MARAQSAALDTAAGETGSEYETNAAAALCLVGGVGGCVKSALGVSRPWITAEQKGAGQLAGWPTDISGRKWSKEDSQGFQFFESKSCLSQRGQKGKSSNDATSHLVYYPVVLTLYPFNIRSLSAPEARRAFPSGIHCPCGRARLGCKEESGEAADMDRVHARAANKNSFEQCTLPSLPSSPSLPPSPPLKY